MLQILLIAAPCALCKDLATAQKEDSFNTPEGLDSGFSQLTWCGNKTRLLHEISTFIF
jgi:hypothetical protein